ncbi:TonB-dependent receptor [Flavisphingomonas formosensis]|uniref:TonB-dependent receptor n=1 Tax=Flavisphingomonas formosensis TaxID=861534 RepID=UPI0012F9C07A|nr:TonB-dependent receptor [Sphingomonas formosensis]
MNISTRNHGMIRLVSTSSVVAMALISTSAFANDAPPAAASSVPAGEAGASLGDIVVTARRVEERLEKVPVAITAFSGAALTERRVLGEQDLQQAVPGLTIRTLNSDLNTNYTLRGQGVDAFSTSASAVATYFNEVNSFGFRTVEFFDMASLQVLKGPQGTLFGRNSTGGAVLYASQAPVLGELSGYGRLGYGNYDTIEVEGAVNIPLTDNLAARVAGLYKSHDGYQTNLFDGSHPGSLKTRDIRGTLLYSSGGIRDQLTVQYSSWRGIGKSLAPWYQDSPLGPGHGAYGFASLAYPSAGYVTAFNPDGSQDYLSPITEIRQLQAKYGFTGYDSYAAWAKANLGFYEVMSRNKDEQSGHQILLTNSFSADLSDDITLKNITGYQYTRSSASGDNIASPFMGQFLGQVSVTTDAAGNVVPQFNYTQPYYIDKGVSNELQLQGKALDSKLNFVVGLYYSWHSAGQSVPYNVFPDSNVFYPDGQGGVDWNLVASANGRGLFDVIYTSYAAFAQANYELLPKLRLTAGIRETHDLVKLRRKGCDAPFGEGACDDKANTNGPFKMSNLSTKSTLPSWTVGLDYQATEHLLLYFAQRGSYRSGSINGSAASFSPERGFYTDPFKPEKTYDFEIGAKFGGRIGTMPARLNVALYDQHIKNIQRSVFFDDGGGQTALTGNVKKGESKGIEVDAMIQPAGWLELGGQGSYTHFRYTDPRATIGSKTFLFGHPADTPTWTGSAYVKFKHEMADNAGRLIYTVDAYGQTSSFFSNLNNISAPADQFIPNAKLPGYHLINMRLQWDGIAGSRVSAAMWVKNLTQEHYYSGVMPMYLLLGVNGSMVGNPRTFGGEVSFKF